MRVLLVDDNRDDRALVARGLAAQHPDLETVEVADADALTVALARAPDLVVTDYQLRFSDGLTLLRQIKSMWPDVPVIMYTGTGSEQVAVEAMKAGLYDYVLKKPGELPRLLAAVGRALETARHRKAAEEAEGRYRRLYDGVPIGLFRAAPDNSLLDCNLALVGMLGYPSREELLARRVLETYRDPAETTALLERLEREGGIQDHEAERLRYDGSTLWARISAVAVRDANGGIAYYEGLVEDLTERKRAEEALKIAEGRLLQAAKLEAVGRLAGGVAHDFNNLLGVIMGYADLMAKRLATEDPLRRNVQEIQKAADRASVLTKQLLAFSRRQVLAAAGTRPPPHHRRSGVDAATGHRGRRGPRHRVARGRGQGEGRSRGRSSRFS